MTSRVAAKFVGHDRNELDFRSLWSYVQILVCLILLASTEFPRHKALAAH